MRVIKKTTITRHKHYKVCKNQCDTWIKIISGTSFASFSDLKLIFGSNVDQVKNNNKIYSIFDISGNHFRLIVKIEYKIQQVYIKYLFTHKEYDKWCKEES